MQLGLTLIIAACFAGIATGAEGRAAPPPTRGSTLTFHGWSQDSRLVAYTRSRLGRTRPDQRMHRFVKGGRFAGFGKMVGGDVARYAHEHGYAGAPAPRRKTGEMAYEFALGRDMVELAVEVGKAQVWRARRGGVLVAEHTFDRIYVGLDVELYPAPDGRQAVLVMHLDTGWEIDAAIFPLALETKR